MYLFLIHFLEYLLLFLNDNVDEESEQYSNGNLRVLLSICSIFCQNQPDIAHKSVAYKKIVYNFSSTLLIKRSSILVKGGPEL